MPPSGPARLRAALREDLARRIASFAASDPVRLGGSLAIGLLVDALGFGIADGFELHGVPPIDPLSAWDMAREEGADAVLPAPLGAEWRALAMPAPSAHELLDQLLAA